eukprot:jgi/Tetstr1/458068/TSEL_044575.t1
MDVHGAPINKLGSLQFLVDPQDEEKESAVLDREPWSSGVFHNAGAMFCNGAELLSPQYSTDASLECTSTGPKSAVSKLKAASGNCSYNSSNESDSTSPDTPIKDCASSLNPVQEERLNNGLPRSPKHAKRMLPEVQAAPEATRHANRSSPDIDDSIPDTPVRPAKLPRAASFCAAPADAKPATSLKEALSHVSAAVANNSEPCIQGQWQWEAGSVRSCSTIPGNMVARDGGEDIDIRSLTAKLATTITSTRPHDQPLTLEELARKTISFAKAPVSLDEKSGVKLQSCWGLDCYTRKNIFEALALCPGLDHSGQPSSSESIAERDHFIEHELLPALQLAGADGWHLANVLSGMEARAKESGSQKTASTCHMLASLITGMAGQEKRGAGRGASRGSLTSFCSSHFRVQTRGSGVVCSREGGIPAGTYVSSFSGEIFAPWRWYEKQDSLRRRHGNLSLSEMHMAVAMPRPDTGDSCGYDVMFVDSSRQGSLGSCIGHSCKPNCVAMTMAADGKLSLGIFTTREVRYGEELTWDHNHVTELEQEYRNATCLCGTSTCRGSAVHYVNSKSFQEVLTKQHAFLDRTALLLTACTDPLTMSDTAILEGNGIGNGLLQATSDAEYPHRPWMAKWSALLLKYIDEEHAALPGALAERAGMPAERAEQEAQTIRSHRLQNLAVTLDKVKYFLRKQPENFQNAPLRMLTDEEVVTHLWTGPSSIAKRFMTTCATGLQHSATGAAALAKLKALLDRTPDTAESARHLFRNLASTFGGLGVEYYAAHDACLLYANTQYFFEPSKYNAISTSLAESDAPVAPGKGSSKAKAGARGASDRDGPSKKYRPGFLWGQMSAWYKQTVRDPSASLSADRRGTVSLPDPESCFGKEASSGRYAKKDRQAMINHIEHMPSVMWPLQTIWSFKNPCKIYGSPMLDVAIQKLRGDASPKARFNDLLREFKNTL